MSHVHNHGHHHAHGHHGNHGAAAANAPGQAQAQQTPPTAGSTPAAQAQPAAQPVDTTALDQQIQALVANFHADSFNGHQPAAGVQATPTTQATNVSDRNADVFLNDPILNTKGGGGLGGGVLAGGGTSFLGQSGGGGLAGGVLPTSKV